MWSSDESRLLWFRMFSFTSISNVWMVSSVLLRFEKKT